MRFTKMDIKTTIAVLATVVFMVKADDIDMQTKRNGMRKILREMVNQTNADALNLPANSTSIRENITDTFSCENRTYGYYADVDNECQIFHVCLPTQTQSGRNVTYKWSFICPKETVFNQEVLVCTRSRESIPCEESPMYYDKNLEFGKVENDTTKNNRKSDTRRKPSKRKENLIVETLFKDAVNRIGPVSVDFEDNKDVITNFKEDDMVDVELMNDDEMADDDERLFSERSFDDKKLRRGFRFKADVE